MEIFGAPVPTAGGLIQIDYDKTMIERAENLEWMERMELVEEC